MEHLSHMENVPSNPAARLHVILMRAKHRSTPDDVQTIVGWGVVLGVERAKQNRSRPEILRRLAILTELPTVVVERVQNAQTITTPGKYLGWSKSIDGIILDPQLSRPFSNVKQRLDSNALALLDICSDQLMQDQQEQAISGEELQSLLALTAQLRHEVRSASLPDHLAQFLLKHVEIIDRAIADVYLEGPEAMKAAFERIAGVVCTNREAYEEVQRTPAHSTYASVLDGLWRLVALGHASVKLLGEFKKVFGELPEPDGP